MLKKINSEIEVFTKDIKDVENCNKLLEHMNKGIYPSIQLLMAVSKNFSILGRVFMFCIIFITGLIMLSSVGAMPFNIGYLIFIDVLLFAFILRFIMNSKRKLFTMIDDIRIELIETKNTQE